MRQYKILWGGVAVLSLLVVFWLSGAVHATPVTLTDLLVGKAPVIEHGGGGDMATSGQMVDLADSVNPAPEMAESLPEAVAPEIKPSTEECVSGKPILEEFKDKVLAAERQMLAPGWVYNYTDEYYFQVDGKKLADGRPVPTHQIGEVWFLLGDYSLSKGAQVMKMYSISRTSDPVLTHWAYETSDASYDLSLGMVSPLDEPSTVRLYPDALDTMLKEEKQSCGGVQVGTWQGKKVFVFTRLERYGSPFTVGKGESALQLSGGGYRAYYDFATGVPVGYEDFRFDANGEEILARRVVERWERQEPPDEMVQQFQKRLQEMER